MVEELVPLVDLLKYVPHHLHRLVEAVEVVGVEGLGAEEEAVLAGHDPRGASGIVEDLAAVAHEADQVASAHRVELAVLDVSVGGVALEPPVHVVGFPPVGEKLASVGSGAVLGEVHVESHGGVLSLGRSSRVPARAPARAGAGFPPEEDVRRSLLLLGVDVAAWRHCVDVVADDRAVGADEDEGDRVESEYALLALLRALGEPVDCESFELLAARGALGEALVACLAALDGDEDDCAAILGDDVHEPSVALGLPGALDDLEAPADEEHLCCLKCLAGEVLHFGDLLLLSARPFGLPCEIAGARVRVLRKGSKRSGTWEERPRRGSFRICSRAYGGAFPARRNRKSIAALAEAKRFRANVRRIREDQGSAVQKVGK